MTPTSSRGSSREAAGDQRPPEMTNEPQLLAGQVMSAEELRRKTKSIIDEYLHLNDLKVCSVIYFISVS